jgi:glycine hydroxymethyltransferase
MGTAAITTLGMGKAEMDELGSILALVLKNTSQAPETKDPSKRSKSKYLIEAKAKAQALERVKALQNRFPVYPELDLEFLKEAFVKDVS